MVEFDVKNLWMGVKKEFDEVGEVFDCFSFGFVLVCI